MLLPDDFLNESLAEQVFGQPPGSVEGRKVGRYRLIQEIGRGGMATVYLGVREDDIYQNRVAIKVIGHLEFAAGAVRRLRHEAQVLSALEHPNIARLIDAGVDHGLAYLVMEYIEGERIDKYLARNAVPLPEILRIFLDLCDALAAAHRALIVHRDLKPSNVLVDSSGRAKLIDFGIAGLLEADPEITVTDRPHFTPAYAAPEQILGGAVSTSVDVFSLGVLLYRCLTGKHPSGITETASSWAQYQSSWKDPVPPSRYLAKPDRDLDAVLLKAIAEDPARRYATMLEFRADLERFLGGFPVLARTGRSRLEAFTKFIRRNPVPMLLSAMLAIAVLGASAASYIWAKRAEADLEAAALITLRVADWTESIRLRDQNAGDRIVEMNSQVLERFSALSTGRKLRRETRYGLALSLLTAANQIGNPGGLYSGTGATALDHLRNAERIVAELSREDPSDVRAGLVLAQVHRGIGSILVERLDLQGARQHFEAALALNLNPKPGPQEVEHRRSQIESQAHLSRVLFLSGQFSECLAIRQRVVELLRAEGERSAVPDHHRILAGSLASRGLAELELGRLADAESSYLEAVRILTTNESEAPRNVIQVQVARALTELSRIKREQQQPGASSEYIGKAVRMLRASLARQDSASTYRYLGLALEQEALTAASFSRPRALAERSIAEACALMEVASEADPQNLLLAREFSRVRRHYRTLLASGRESGRRPGRG